MTTRQLCTFWVDGLLFGLEVTDVQEVMRAQEMTPVPLAPTVIRGLIHLRGQIVTALDMRARLALPPRVDGEPAMNVLVRNSGSVVSLLVDDIGDVVEVSEAAFERPPETLPALFRELIGGVYKLERRLLLLVDAARLIDMPSASATSQEAAV